MINATETVTTSSMSDPAATSSDTYWFDSRRPLASLIFLVPWIVIYEAGVLMLGDHRTDELRNGADYWMRSWLSVTGASQVLLLPILVLFGLIGWHLLRRHPWKLNPATQIGMLAESVLLALGLVAIGQIHDLVFRAFQPASEPLMNVGVVSDGQLTAAVTFIGAGVYEEVMFRLLLVPAAFLVFRLFEFPAKWAAVMAAVSTSFVFALAHHIGPSADAFHLFTFTFRAAAGCFFAAVFFVRGFGITVGCHATYDLLVGILLVQPIEQP
jgi:membrane protease YdiL (CAAX protease family)